MASSELLILGKLGRQIRFMLRWSSCHSYGRRWEVFEGIGKRPLSHFGTNMGRDKEKEDEIAMETEYCTVVREQQLCF